MDNNSPAERISTHSFGSARALWAHCKDREIVFRPRNLLAVFPLIYPLQIFYILQFNISGYSRQKCQAQVHHMFKFEINLIFRKTQISSIDKYGVCLLPQRLRLNLLADSLDYGHRLVANIKQASFFVVSYQVTRKQQRLGLAKMKYIDREVILFSHFFLVFSVLFVLGKHFWVPFWELE